MHCSLFSRAPAAKKNRITYIPQKNAKNHRSQLCGDNGNFFLGYQECYVMPVGSPGGVSAFVNKNLQHSGNVQAYGTKKNASRGRVPYGDGGAIICASFSPNGVMNTWKVLRGVIT